MLRKIGENQILSVAVSVVIGVYCPPCTIAFNAAMADANGGTISQILTGAAIGAITYGVGVDSAGFIESGLTGALSSKVGNLGATLFMGGALAKAQGGKFIDGVKGAALGAAVSGLINKGITAYKNYQMRKSVVFGGSISVEFGSPAMDNTLGAVPEPTTAADAVNTALPAETAANKALPKSVPELELDLSPTTSGEYRAPVKSIDNVSNGLSFTIEEIKFGAAIAADHANKFVPWLYGKGLQIGGHVVKGVGIFTKNLAIENSGDILIDAGRAITPEDHVINR